MLPAIPITTIPIVGQVSTKLGWWPTTLLRCHCTLSEGGLTIIVLTGLNNPSACPRCHRLYKAVGFLPNEQGELSPVVESIPGGPVPKV